MNGSVMQRAVRRGLDTVLRPVGARILTRAEQVAVERRRRSLVEQVYTAYAPRFTPPLTDRPGRMELIHRLVGTETTEAMFLLHWLQQALEGPGDVCEFGVAQGATSALIAHEIRDTDRKLWLYDSFQGLSRPHPKDELIDDIFGLGSMDRYTATMAYPIDAVRGRLAGVGFPADRTRIVAGFLTADLPADQLPEVVAFAYLDFDLYEPIRVGLELLHPRCRPGSALMVDDYGFFSAGPQTAVAEFLAAHPGAYELEEAHPGVGHFCLLRRTG
jgi:hypothetical protein